YFSLLYRHPSVLAGSVRGCRMDAVTPRSTPRSVSRGSTKPGANMERRRAAHSAWSILTRRHYYETRAIIFGADIIIRLKCARPVGGSQFARSAIFRRTNRIHCSGPDSFG